MIDSLDFFNVLSKITTIYLILLIADSTLIQDPIRELYKNNNEIKHITVSFLIYILLSESTNCNWYELIQLTFITYILLIALTRVSYFEALLILLLVIPNILYQQYQNNRINTINNSTILTSNEKNEKKNNVKNGTFYSPLTVFIVILGLFYFSSFSREKQFGGNYSDWNFFFN
jgi:hypothetical protein